MTIFNRRSENAPPIRPSPHDPVRPSAPSRPPHDPDGLVPRLEAVLRDAASGPPRVGASAMRELNSATAETVALLRKTAAMHNARADELEADARRVMGGAGDLATKAKTLFHMANASIELLANSNAKLEVRSVEVADADFVEVETAAVEMGAVR